MWPLTLLVLYFQITQKRMLCRLGMLGAFPSVAWSPRKYSDETILPAMQATWFLCFLKKIKGRCEGREGLVKDPERT